MKEPDQRRQRAILEIEPDRQRSHDEALMQNQPSSEKSDPPPILAPLWRHALERPDLCAVSDESGALSYAELRTAIEAQLDRFRANGIAARDPVLVLFDVCVESVVAYWALHGIGAILVVGDPTGTRADIDHYIEATGALHVVAGARADQQVLSSSKLIVHRRTTVEGAAFGVWEKIAVGGTNPAAETVKHRSECGLILFSSGTTGKPKAIAHSREALVALHETLLKTWKLSPTDVVLGALPFHTIYGLIFSAASTIYAGATLVLIERFHPERALRSIERREVTTAAFVPAMIIMILNYAKKDRFDCSSLRMVYSASAPISESDIERFSDFAGTTVICNYGMTEIPGAAVEVAGRPHQAGSAGRVSPGFEISIRDEGGKVLPLGEVGEIAMRGPSQMLEYLGEPEMTAKRVRDGWIYSQDKGRMDAGGNVYVLGRTSEMIIRGGLNISPLEIENTLASHDAVVDVAVVGPADAVLGQIVSAFVVPLADVPRDQLKELLKQHCSDHLAPPKVPAEYFIIEEIPRNAAGKISRKELLAARDALLGRY